MLLEIFIKGHVRLRFLLTLKMGHKRRKVENHCTRKPFWSFPVRKLLQ